MAKKPAKPAKTTKTKSPSSKPIKATKSETQDMKSKYTFLYLFFAACTLIFALTTVYLYSFTNNVIRRYDNFVRYMQDNANNQDNQYEGEE